MITLEHALAHPTVPAGIVLVDTGLVARPDDREVLGQLGAELVAGEVDPARWWELVVPVLYAEDFRARCPEHVREAGRRFAEGGLHAKHAVFQALVGRRDPRPLLSRLQVPTLVVAAEHDALWDVDDHRATAAHFPSARSTSFREQGTCRWRKLQQTWPPPSWTSRVAWDEPVRGPPARPHGLTGCG